MSKSKKEIPVISINADNIDDALDALKKKPFEITSGTIKEGKCIYGYEIKTGPTAGDKIPKRNGDAYAHDGMFNAFSNLNIHLAIIDDAFKISGIEVTSLDALEEHAITENYHVNKFSVSGENEDESIVIEGEKWVTTGSITIASPKIKTKSSNYPFFEELREAIENCRSEVEAYMNGKSAPKAEQAEFDFSSNGGNTETDEFDKPL